MVRKAATVIVLVSLTALLSCNKNERITDMNIIFLHHSTGDNIWGRAKPSLSRKVIKRVSPKLVSMMSDKAHLPTLLHQYNKENNKAYHIEEMFFPKSSPYGWNNYPYDYYNIWVENAGEKPYKEEPTLEILTRDYQVIIFKHCFPVSNITEGSMNSSDINSEEKTLENYQLQYLALRDKLHEFPETKFILFTGAVNVEANMSEEEAFRAKTFFDWVKNEWNQPGDNIYLWDLYSLQTEGGLFFKKEYAVSPTDSHPNESFSEKVGGLLFNRIIDVIEKEGDGTSLTGEKI